MMKRQNLRLRGKDVKTTMMINNKTLLLAERKNVISLDTIQYTKEMHRKTKTDKFAVYNMINTRSADGGKQTKISRERQKL